MTLSMACCYDYGNRQRFAFYMVGVGLALCIVGCASPFWLSGKVLGDEEASYLTKNLPRVDSLQGEMTNFDVNVGLWWYCVGLEGREQLCFQYPPEGYASESEELQGDSRAYIMFVRTLMCACLLVALIGLLIVCFYCCTCCANGHTLGYGLTFFAAGLLGFGAVFILTFKVDVLLSLPETRTSFGWALPVFLTGNSLMVIASVILCIPSPKAGSGYETMFTFEVPQHELIGQMSAFEAFPEPATLTICKTDV